MNFFITLLLAVILYNVEGRFSSVLKDAIIEELMDEYKQRHDDIDERFCKDTGLTCYKCAECHDNLQFGLCVDGAVSSKCLCKWGWTGPNPIKVSVANEVSAWSRNRIRADNCKTPCHYTHDYWNSTCLINGGGSGCSEQVCENKHGGYAKCINDVCVPDCDETECAKLPGKCEKGKCIPTCDEYECAAKGGKCLKGVCKEKCCRGASGANAIYVSAEDTYYADDCKTTCPYLGTGVENPDCTKEPPSPCTCDPKCKQTGGQCNQETGKCKCCKDFTGPNPVYDEETKSISADYCDTYCPYVKAGKMNQLCINDNYISRSSTKITL